MWKISRFQGDWAAALPPLRREGAPWMLGRLLELAMILYNLWIKVMNIYIYIQYIYIYRSNNLSFLVFVVFCFFLDPIHISSRWEIVEIVPSHIFLAGRCSVWLWFNSPLGFHRFKTCYRSKTWVFGGSWFFLLCNHRFQQPIRSPCFFPHLLPQPPQPRSVFSMPSSHPITWWHPSVVQSVSWRLQKPLDTVTAGTVGLWSTWRWD